MSTKNNKVTIILLAFIVLVAISIGLAVFLCSRDTTKVNKEYYNKINTGLDKLRNFNDDYIVSHVLNAPDGTVSYLNVTTSGGNYNEYPVDKDGNIGKVDADAKEITYTLTDWLSNDTYYLIYGDDTSSGFTYLPKGYTSTISSRKYMYLDIMMDSFTSIEYLGNSKIDLGAGEELVDIYSCELPSSKAQEILGINTVGLYESVAKEYKDDKNITKFCDFYLEDNKKNLACSDAIITVGLDSNGLVRYVGLEVGGLGTRLYYSMTMVTKIEDTLRTPPAELSSAVSYYDVIKDYAALVAQYDSYSEALDAMQGNSGVDLPTEVETTTPTTEEETTAEKSTSTEEATTNE